MNTLNSIQKPEELFTLLCEASANKQWDTARDIAEEITNIGAQGTWLDLAYDLADGLKTIYKASDHIFSVENPLSEEHTQLIIESQHWVSNTLNLPAPTLIIEVTADDVPTHAITGFNNFGFIAINSESIKNKSLLVHEITHCSLMSRALFLDEGLATLLEYKYKQTAIHIDETDWNRPSLAAIIESDWSYDPYFSHIAPVETNFAEPIEGDHKAHKLAAFLVTKFIQNKGMEYVVTNWKKLKPSFKDGRTYEVIKNMFAVDLWELDATLYHFSETKYSSKTAIELLDMAKRALALGDKSIITPHLEELRLRAFQNLTSLNALVRALILFGINGNDDAKNKFYRTEALAAINWAKTRGCDEQDLRFFEVYTYVFKLRNAAHAINMRKIGTQTSLAFEKLLKDYPNEPEVLITSARAQIKTYYDMLPLDSWREKLTKISTHNLYGSAAEQLLNEDRFLLQKTN
ncbi:hypothetical protein [Tenacibaculum sp. M341]|uniref:hypothetical protein n=1 Tax=Tenacibaculum sp. M341 TaxID=2530339 RepID=UPI00104311E0|nr:hypothetical protein [Tenacibaculum sp. M341]TCI93815.1 hypothetical protein EYW44_05200 [Tenacibaculum sp. M341]